ncbi:coiled-coil-helix-coiled-coil-helix domain-containing protein 5 [Heliangelus exortis]|uniref:coiled-coil-helix-coiled-coil-helix domain-containing protein 5 n=1 Tax=Heliangelus exortis TaxID=472823 RepID=UPI003A91E8D7
MLAALAVTSRHCRHQMELYGRCVATNPESWQRHCHHLRLDVTRCAAEHPIVQRIRQECSEPFAAFEQCLKQNPTSVLSCSPQVKAFLLCADQVKP